MVRPIYYCLSVVIYFFFFSNKKRHTRLSCDWSSDVCSSDLPTRYEAIWHHIWWGLHYGGRGEIGRGAGRERGEVSGGAGLLKKKKKKTGRAETETLGGYTTIKRRMQVRR